MKNDLYIDGVHYLTAREAGDVLGYAPDYISRLCREGKLRGRRSGKSWIVEADSLVPFLKQHEAKKQAWHQDLSRELKSVAEPAQPLVDATFIPLPKAHVAPRELHILRNAERRTRTREHARAQKTVKMIASSALAVLLFAVGALAFTSNFAPGRGGADGQVAAASFFSPISSVARSAFAGINSFACSVTGWCGEPQELPVVYVRAPGSPNVATTEMPAPVQNITNNISNYIQPNVGGGTVLAGGVSEQLLDSRLNALENYLTGRIDSVAYEGVRQTSDLGDDIAGIGGAGFDDIDITDSTWTGGSISGASISGGSISGTTLSLSGDATLTNLTATNSTTTNATSTNMYISGSFGFGSDTGLLRNTAGIVSTLANGSNGQVLKITGGTLAWGTDSTGSGGGGSSFFASTTDDLAIYPADTTDVVIVGSNATTTVGNILEIAGASLFRGAVTGYGTVTAPRFVATSSVASVLPYASTTALSATTLCISSDCRSAWATDSSFSTTSADYWKGVTSFFSTTSEDYYRSVNNFFSTTSSDYWKTSNNFFSTTSSDYWKTQNDFFSTSSAIFFVNGSTTIPKTYTANTFNALQTFSNASSTLFSSGYASSTSLFAGNFTLGTLNGLLKSTNGLVSTAVAGTDYLTSADVFAYPFGLAGNATSTLTQFNGGLTAYASSTIGAGGQATGLTISGGASTTGNLYVSGNVGIGTTSPYTTLGVDGTVAASTFNADGSNTVLSSKGQAFAFADVAGNAVSVGFFNTASGAQNSAFGINNSASGGTFSQAFGYGNTASGYLASAFGTQNTASNNTSLAFGASNNVSGTQASAFGYALVNAVDFSTMIGPSDASKLTIRNNQRMGFGTTTPFAGFSLHANNGETNTTLFAIASSTASATTTLFSIGNTGTITTALGDGLVKSTGGVLGLASAGTDYANFGYLFPSNATTTLLSFGGGLTSAASTTIGNGAQAGGLTISGGATTTGNAYFAGNVGIGTTGPLQKLHVAGDVLLTGSLRDTNNNIWLSTEARTSAVNYIQVRNSETGVGVGLFATGADTNTNLSLRAKGAGYILFNDDNSNALYTQGASSGGVSFGSTASNVGLNFTLGINTTPSMVLQATTGNVGVGTTSPYAKLSVAGDVVGGRFIATTSIASVFPYASTTALSATTLCISADCRSAWAADSAFSTTSADYWKGVTSFFSTTSEDYYKSVNNFFSTSSAQYFASVGLAFSTTSSDVWKDARNFFSTTSVDYWKNVTDLFSTTSASAFLAVNQGAAFSSTSASYFLSQNGGLGFSTTSSDYWQSQRNFFSTTSADFWKTANDFFSTTSAINFVNSSTTIPKTYTANAFTDLQSFVNASSTLLSSSYASSTNAFFGNLSLGSLSGLLKATNGTVTAAVEGVDYSAFAYPFPNNATSTTLTFSGGLLITASTTINGNATTTGMFGVGSLFLNTEHFTDLTGTGLTNTGGALTLNATGDWTGTFDGLEGSAYLANSFSSTSANYWKSVTDLFSTTSANYFVSSSTTIPKTYTANTFTALQTIPFASSTAITVSGTASTTNLLVSSAGGSTGCAQFSVTGLISNTGTACGSGSGTFSWTPTNNFGVNTNATSTALSLLGGLNASSTVRFGNAGQNMFLWDSSTGKLGIGTTTPFASLSVHSTAGLSQFVIGSSTATQFIVDMNGNVGVGTTSPSKLFSVNGNGYFGGTSGTTTIEHNANVMGLLKVGTDSILLNGSGTSTFSNGIDLSNGCFALAGSCILTGGLTAGDLNSSVNNFVNAMQIASSSAKYVNLVDGVADSFGSASSANLNGIDQNSSTGIVTSTNGIVATGATTTAFLTSGTSLTVPSGWNNSDNTIETIGAGGGGRTTTTVGGGGGGGGGYSKSINITLTPSASVAYAIGTGGGAGTTGGDTYICNDTSNCASIGGSAVVVGAKGGVGSAGTAGGAGGASGSGVGTTKNSGGNGGTGSGASDDGGGGGGGAAGPNGVGAAGGNGASDGGGGGGGANGGSTGSNASGATGGVGGNNRLSAGGGASNGGAGSNGGGGGGGNGSAGGITGGAGSRDAIWTQSSDAATAGPGGGGGGGGGNSTTGGSGGAGGSYGAGGGGGADGQSNAGTGGSGYQGIIVLKYLPTTSMILSNTFTASTSPEVAKLLFAAKSSASFTLNTDITAAVSRDGGTSWATTTLVSLSALEDGTTLYGDTAVDLSSQPAGTSMKYRIFTANSKVIEIYGIALQWGATSAQSAGTLSVTGALSAQSLSLTSALSVSAGGTGWSNLEAGRLLFGNGTSALATSSSLFWDNSNSRLGIGTTSPGSALSIQGNIFLAGNLVSTSTTASILPYASTSALTISGTASTTNLIVSSAGGSTGCAQFDSSGVLSNTGTACGTGSGGSDFTFSSHFGSLTAATSSPTLFSGNLFASSTVRFGAANGTQFLFDSSLGRLGIGTTTPFATLSIQATTTQTSPLFEIASTSAATKFLSVAGDGFGTTTLSGLNINGSATSTSNVGFNLSAGCFAVNGTCISSSGSSGVTLTAVTTYTSSQGYTKPSGMAYIVVEVWGGGGGGGDCDVSSDGCGGGGGAGYAMKKFTVSNLSGTSTPFIQIGAAGVVNNDTTGDTGGTSAFAGMATSTGGIGGNKGTDSDVAGGNGGTGSGGDINLTGQPGQAAESTTGLIGSGNGGSAPRGGGGGKAAGNNGGSAGAGGTCGGGGGGATNAGAGGVGCVVIYEYTTTGLAVGSVGEGTQGQLSFYNATGQDLTATSSIFLAQTGNVGIGTTSPTHKLTVGGIGYFGGATGTTTIEHNANIMGFLKVGTSSIFLNGNGTSTFSGGLQTSALSITGATATSTSNVGMNLTGGCFSVNDTCIGGQSLSGTTGQFAFFSGTNTQSATSTLFLNTNSFVGIGTTTPQWLLNPTSASAAQLALSAGAGLAQWAFRNAGGNFYLATTTVSGTATTTLPAFMINGTNGNIGIGTTSPAYALDVNGDVNVANGKCFRVNGVCIGYTVKLAAIYATTTAGTNASVVFTGSQGSAPSFSAATLTLPSNISSMTVEMIGGGGGGGGVSTDSGAGGGAGAYFRKHIATPSGTYRYTVGSGGPGNTSSGAGTNGADSCLSSGGSTACNATLTVATSTGGTGGSGNGGNGGSGGTATGGDINLPGQGGGDATSPSTAGVGGGSVYGDGGRITNDVGAPGIAGSGGAGGNSLGGNDNGGNGGNGLMIITVYATSSPNAAGNDYAEMFPVSNPGIMAGDIVSVDVGVPVSMKLAQKGDTALAGVVSTNPGHVLGDQNATGQRPIALSGRVPVKVHMGGGELKLGDRIAPSATPGVGRKAGPFDDSVGIVIGPVETDANGTRTVMVFLDLHQGIDINSIAMRLLGEDIFASVATSTGTSAASTTAMGTIDFVGGMMSAIAKRIDSLASYEISASSGTTTASTTNPIAATSTNPTDQFADKLMHSIFARITNWLAYAQNGIEEIFAKTIRAENVYADTMHANQLCLEDICVTKDELLQMLDNAGASPATAPVVEPEPDSASSTPEETPTEKPAEDHSAPAGSGEPIETAVEDAPAAPQDTPEAVPTEAPEASEEQPETPSEDLESTSETPAEAPETTPDTVNTPEA